MPMHKFSRLQNRIICKQNPENLSAFLSIISIEALITESHLQKWSSRLDLFSVSLSMSENSLASRKMLIRMIDNSVRSFCEMSVDKHVQF